MGLMLAAPTVSRTLTAMTPTLDLGAWCTGHGYGHSHGVPASPGHADTGDTCGYCALLGHSPALTSTAAMLLLPRPPSATHQASPPISAAYGSTLPHHPRGPPIA